MEGETKDMEASATRARDASLAKPEQMQIYTSVLHLPPCRSKQSLPNYQNLTPCVKSFFFAHTYLVYVYTFYMFVFAFYKGYALQYPKGRAAWELVLIMTLPCLQHLRFYFGYWGLELGMVYDISFFLLLSSITITVLTYFLFFQAYIMPLEMSILTIAIAAVIVESVCGIINVLQTLKLAPLTFFQTLLLLSAIISVIMVTSGFLVKELLPNEITFDHYWMPADGQPYAVAAPSS
ncbi:85P [Symbiodinium sp. CCMP2456]|nr:85P [Symbiodinium sp. CCMP2456]